MAARWPHDRRTGPGLPPARRAAGRPGHVGTARRPRHRADRGGLRVRGPRFARHPVHPRRRLRGADAGRRRAVDPAGPRPAGRGRPGRAGPAAYRRRVGAGHRRALPPGRAARPGADRARRSGTACTSSWPGCRPGASTSTGSAPAATSPRSGGPAPRRHRPRLSPLTMCFTSCAHYEHGYFTAYARLAEEEPDLVLHLGDYIYEYGRRLRRAARRHRPRARRPRDRHAGRLPQAARPVQDRPRPAGRARRRALAGRLRRPRGRERLGRRGPRAARGSARRLPAAASRRVPGLLGEHAAAPRAAPARARDMQLYRRVRWGATATSTCSTPASTATTRPVTATVDCPARTDPARSLPGPAQERWLAAGLRRSRRPLGRAGPAGVLLPARPAPRARRAASASDAWDGYPASRDRVVDALGRRRGVRNPVVLTGDVHAHWAADLRRRSDDPAVAGRRHRAGVLVDHLRRRRIGGRPAGLDAAGREPAPALPQQPAGLRPHPVHRGPS